MNRRERGSSIVVALIFTLIAGMLIAGTLAYTASHMKLSGTRRSSEAALLLAEGGINSELRRLTTVAQQGEAALKTTNASFLTNQTQSGEPYPGRPGTVKGVPGKYWVLSYSTNDGANVWQGERSLYIRAIAEVNGARRQVEIGGPDMGRGIFNDYAVFGVDGAGGGNQAALGFTGSNNRTTIEGTIATNGYVGTGNYNLTFEQAINFNVDALKSGGKSYAFPSGPDTAEVATPETFPSVVSIARTVRGLSATATESDVVDHLKTLNHNGTRLHRLVKNKATFGEVTAADLTPLGLKNNDRWALINKKGNNKGIFHGTPSLSGYTQNGTSLSNVQIVVVPPGDYLWESIDLQDDINTVLVMDNANHFGLVPNNADGTIPQIRFWLFGTGQKDNIAAPMAFTDTSDAGSMRFRVYYGKDGSELSIMRKPGLPFGDYVFRGGYYGVTGGAKGTKVDFIGNTNDNTLITVYGSLIADRVEFNGNVRVVQPATMQHPDDPRTGFVFRGNYREF